MDRSTLLNRIKQLLNKTTANGCTEDEATTALSAAQRIMDEHRIALAEVVARGDESAEYVTEVAAEIGVRYPMRLRLIAPVVEQIFGVEIFVSVRRCRENQKIAGHVTKIFGEASTVAAASWAFGFLDETFDCLWRRYRIKTGAKTVESTNYFCGLGDGLLSKLVAARTQTAGQIGSETHFAIVLANSAVKQAFAEAIPGVKQLAIKYQSASETYGHGLRDGRDINLARPIERPSRSALGSTPRQIEDRS
jgi:hypothetical protein